MSEGSPQLLCGKQLVGTRDGGWKPVDYDRHQDRMWVQLRRGWQYWKLGERVDSGQILKMLLMETGGIRSGDKGKRRNKNESQAFGFGGRIPMLLEYGCLEQWAQTCKTKFHEDRFKIWSLNYYFVTHCTSLRIFGLTQVYVKKVLEFPLSPHLIELQRASNRKQVATLSICIFFNIFIGV